MPFAQLIIDEGLVDAEKKRFCSRGDEDHEKGLQRRREIAEELRNNFKYGTKKEKRCPCPSNGILMTDQHNIKGSLGKVTAGN